MARKYRGGAEGAVFCYILRKEQRGALPKDKTGPAATAVSASGHSPPRREHSGSSGLYDLNLRTALAALTQSASHALRTLTEALAGIKARRLQNLLPDVPEQGCTDFILEALGQAHERRSSGRRAATKKVLGQGKEAAVVVTAALPPAVRDGAETPPLLLAGQIPAEALTARAHPPPLHHPYPHHAPKFWANHACTINSKKRTGETPACP